MKLDQDNTSQCGTQKNSHLSPNEQLSPLKVSVVRFILLLKGDIAKKIKYNSKIRTFIQCLNKNIRILC